MYVTTSVRKRGSHIHTSKYTYMYIQLYMCMYLHICECVYVTTSVRKRGMRRSLSDETPSLV